MSNAKMTFAQRAQLETLWFLCRGFALLPRWFRYYVFESVVHVILCYVLRYRRKVVWGNLCRSFPAKSPDELRRIRRRFYRTLAEIFVDTVSLAGVNTIEKARRMIRYPDVAGQSAATSGRDWIAMMAHFGCWEFGSFWGLWDPTQAVVAVYHPLRNVVMEELYHRLRNHANTRTVAMHECLRFYLRHRDEGLDGRNMVIGLIADQNPPRRPDSHWFRFLNQDTLFFDGGERLAIKCGLPVYFARMDRVRRGFYEMTFELIYDGREPVAENEITERYVRRLEAMIEARPELWMWSHRRWKHKREPQSTERTHPSVQS